MLLRRCRGYWFFPDYGRGVAPLQEDDPARPLLVCADPVAAARSGVEEGAAGEDRRPRRLACHDMKYYILSRIRLRAHDPTAASVMRLHTSCRRTRTGLALFLSLAIGGCSSDGGDTSTRRWTSGDTLVVENSAPLHSARARLVPVARYGAFDDAGPATLVRVHSLAVAPNGDVILYDNEQGIKRYDVGGDFKSWVAKAGKGPGEVAMHRRSPSPQTAGSRRSTWKTAGCSS